MNYAMFVELAIYLIWSLYVYLIKAYIINIDRNIHTYFLEDVSRECKLFLIVLCTRSAPTTQSAESHSHLLTSSSYSRPANRQSSWSSNHS